MHPSIHHHQENIFGPNDESIDIIIQGAIDNDATDNPVFVDEASRQRGRVLDHADRVVEHLAAPEDGSVWKQKQFWP